MSGGGETLSSISEKSCISQPGNPSPQGQQPINGNSMNTQNGTLPMQLIHNHPNDFMGPLAYVVSLSLPKYGVVIRNVKVTSNQHNFHTCIHISSRKTTFHIAEALT